MEGKGISFFQNPEYSTGGWRAAATYGSHDSAETTLLYFTVLIYYTGWPKKVSHYQE